MTEQKRGRGRPKKEKNQKQEPELSAKNKSIHRNKKGNLETKDERIVSEIKKNVREDNNYFRCGKTHVPTDESRKEVSLLAGFGVPFAQIAALLKINTDTLKKYYDFEMQNGKGRANAKIGQTLYQKAIGGDTAALIFWAKTQMKWCENIDAAKILEMSNGGGSIIVKWADNNESENNND